jgi:hypothetical protein
MQFQDRSEAIVWIIRNQLGRRNATQIQKAPLYIRLAKELQSRKTTLESGERTKTVRQPSQNSGTLPVVSVSQSVAEEVGRDAGVSATTVRAGVKWAAAMDKLAAKSPLLREAVENKEINKKDAKLLSAAPRHVLKQIENVPEQDRPAAAKLAAQGMRKESAQAAQSGRPIVTEKALHELEKAAGALVRANTAALEACGGKHVPEAWHHYEMIRHLMSGWLDDEQHVPSPEPPGGRWPGVFDLVLSFQKVFDRK